jgi:acyl transferase domain-containing protein/3-hydroxymyristoyl/3-hydroxydecanoyl-(acyl carrier protein) dehydratase
MCPSPIAIVGRGCILPGAASPCELWELIAAGRCAITDAEADDWRAPPAAFLTDPDCPQPDRTWTLRGGYVRGFEARFDASGFRLPEAEVLACDRQVRWLLHAGRQALGEAGYRPTNPLSGAGLIIGNLSYPTDAHTDFAQAVWGDRNGRCTPARVRSRDRFSSGLPAALAARALGCEAGGLALDAACASALYAVKLACDRLQDRTADLMLAGAVNAADALFLQLGFAALGGLSRSGQSRPFHRDADGLLPAQGAVIVALRRLEDALADGQRVLGVIRGIGLSNDGAGHGFLVPDPEGQFRALCDAYRKAGVEPASVSLVECHATGTPVGDRAELASMGRIFADCSGIPIGSAKSNFGHLLAAAGGAALLKVLGALDAGVRPATLGAEDPMPELARSPFRLLGAVEPWEARAPRRAGVSAFGFGGNNVHLIVEEWDGTSPARASIPAAAPDVDLAVVALGVRAAGGECTEDFVRHLLVKGPDPSELPGGGKGFPAGAVAVPVSRLRTPPQELSEALGQQTLLQLAALDALEGLDLPPERTAVFVGMGCDPESTRHGGRWRSGAEGWAEPLTAARVKGTMPNIPANQLNRLFDLRGPGFTLSAEEASGLAALDVARRGLAAGEFDAAVVGAVDLSCETVHRAAAADHLPAGRQVPGDAAVILVVQRLADAQAAGRRVLAVLPADRSGPRTGPSGAPVEMALDDKDPDLAGRFGHAHAASGLLLVAAGTVACAHAARPGATGLAIPWVERPEDRAVLVRVAPLGGGEHRVRLTGLAGGKADAVPTSRLGLRCYAGGDRAELLARVAADAPGGDGPVRLALLAEEAELETRRQAAVAALREDNDPGSRGTWFAARPQAGEVAFVFTGAAAGYPGMGQELLLAFPDLWEALLEWAPHLRQAPEVLCPSADSRLGLAARTFGSWALSQFHAAWSRDVLGLGPKAALGVSAGEISALHALGAWDSPDSLFADLSASGLQERELGGEFRSVRRHWEALGLLKPGEAVEYTCWQLRHPAEEVRAALASEPRVRITMIFAPNECCISGQAADCRRVLDRLKAPAWPMDFEMAVHCPELGPSTEVWRRIHRRPTSPVPGVRFYSNADNNWYVPTADSVADAYTRQALQAINFPATIERAWRDGVRVFLEHGPRGMLSNCINRVLGEREHLAVSYDVAGRSPVAQLLEATARLWCAGVVTDLGRALEVIRRGRPTRRAEVGALFTLSTRMPEVRLVEPRVPGAAMPPAPPLPPVDAPLQPPAKRRPRRTSVGLTELVAGTHRSWLACMTAGQAAFLGLQRNLAHGPGNAVRFSDASAKRSAPERFCEASLNQPVPTGLSLTREQLEALASGPVSAVFGPLFEQQDSFTVQVRMPMPPLLLADRVVELRAEPGSLGTGSICTETDVSAHAWYLHAGRMPAGLMIEAGQADLLLISYLGIDFHLRGRRRYRLLGCDLTYHGPLTRPGETLRYEIHIDSHARMGDVRLFFFHYDCFVDGRLRMSVRNGQAGFFTEEELARSEGVLWNPATADFDRAARLDPPRVACTKHSLSRRELEAFAAGDAYGCFGPGIELAGPHTRTPAIPGGKLLLLDWVTALDHRGGPCGRGYLRAEAEIVPDAWFFAGHFKGDPCMPGTLMFEGCFQALAVYLASLGYTLDRDGWRFEPVEGHELKMRCRGQVVPTSRELTYEVFVESVIAGDEPTLFADVVCSVDGLKAFHCRALGVRLVPGWPLEDDPYRGTPDRAAAPAASCGDVAGNHEAMMACALGRPSAAFGRMYARFDGPRGVPRLPAPPYLCVSRITAMPAKPGTLAVGEAVEAELDLEDDAWYFADNGAPCMPLSVLTEAALQPCGWLASFVGCVAASAKKVCFRNLDGAGTVHGPVLPGGRPLVTRATLTDLSRVGQTILTGFQVECRQGSRPVLSLRTKFGFFPPEALAEQVGLAPDTPARAPFDAPANAAIDLCSRPAAYFGGPCRLADRRLLMLDRITYVAATGGRAGLGTLRAEKDVDPREWFFKAHFFQDPVQPGSLGLEAMAQLLQFHMLHAGMHDNRDEPRFEPIACGAVEWKFRGQVLPTNKTITVTAEITEAGADDDGAFVAAEAALWVDGLRIYHARRIAMRLIGKKKSAVAPPRVGLASGLAAPVTREFLFDPAEHPWVHDHCPTYVVPALPLSCLADQLAEAALAYRPGARVVGLEDVRAFRWLVCDRARRLRTEVGAREEGRWKVRLLADADEGGGWELIAAGTVLTAADWPAPPPLLEGLHEGEEQACPYWEGRLFHGPAFQYMRTLRTGREGSSSHLDPEAGSVEPGTLTPGLLDAATHGIPHDDLRQWFPAIAPGMVAYPQAIRVARFFGPAPTTFPVCCEARPWKSASPTARPEITIQLAEKGRLWVEMVLEEVCLPKGPLGEAAPARRRAFLRDRQFIEGMGLGRAEEGATVLERRAVKATDWLPGTVAAVYAADPAADLGRQVAVKEHVARVQALHPSAVRWHDGKATVWTPAGSYPIRIEDDGKHIRVRDAAVTPG